MNKENLKGKMYLVKDCEKPLLYSVVKIKGNCFNTIREQFFEVEQISEIDMQIKESRMRKIDISKSKEIDNVTYSLVKKSVKEIEESKTIIKNIFKELKWQE